MNTIKLKTLAFCILSIAMWEGTKAFIATPLDAKTTYNQATTASVSDAQIVALEKRLATIEKAVSVDSSGKVTIKSPTGITIEAGATIDIKSNSRLNLNAAGVTQLDGRVVQINSGQRPVAYLGASVGDSKITTGSGSVLVP